MCEMWGWCVQQRRNWEWNIDEYDIVFMLHMCYDSGKQFEDGLQCGYEATVVQDNKKSNVFSFWTDFRILYWWKTGQN